MTKPHARLITHHGDPFWMVFTPPYKGHGYCGTRGDCSLAGAYASWRSWQ